MTREEAIKQLKKCRSFHNGSYGEAFAMAIKALEQEPCEDWCDVPSDEMTLEQARQAVKDLRKKLAEYLMKETCENCISRQAAIELKPEFLNPNVNRETEEQTAIDRAYARGWNSCNTHWIDEISELPSAQPERKKGNEKCSNELPCGWRSLFDTPCFGRGGEQDE